MATSLQAQLLLDTFDGAGLHLARVHGQHRPLTVQLDLQVTALARHKGCALRGQYDAKNLMHTIQLPVSGESILLCGRSIGRFERECKSEDMEARARRVGLWRDEAPVPPGDFREARRDEPAQGHAQGQAVREP